MPAPRFLHRPLVLLAMAAFFGSWAGYWGAGRKAWIWAAISILGLAAGCKWRRGLLAWLLAAGFCAFAGRAAWLATPGPDAIGRWVPRRDIAVVGRLAALPQAQPRYQRWSGVLQCERVVWHGQTQRVSGRLRFDLPGCLPVWNPGDQLEIRGRLRPAPPQQNPGEFNPEVYFQRRGIQGTLRGMTPADASRIRAAPGWSWGAMAAGTRRWLADGIRGSTPDRRRELVAALVTGDRSGLTLPQTETLAAAGLAHLLAVSGMNVGIVFATVTCLAGWLRAPFLLRWLAGFASVGLLVLSTGADAPVVRAAVMCVAVGVSVLAGRPADPASGLAFAGLAILAWDPASSLDPGFQLSFAATAGVLTALAFPWSTRLPVWLRLLGQAGLVSLSACVFTLPLTLYYFYSLPLAGLFTNLLAAPLLDLIVISGSVAGLATKALPILGSAAGQAAAAAALGLEWLAAQAARLPGGRLFLYPPSALGVIWFFAILGLGIWAPRLRPLAGIGLLAWCLVYPCHQPAAPKPGGWRLTFLCLAQGESTLIEAGGRRWLLDTGSETDFYRRVKPYLASQGIGRLDGLWISHWDQDHAAGAEACLRYFQVDTLYTAGVPEALPRDIQQRVRVRRAVRGEQLQLGDILIRVHWPPAATPGHSNDHCLVTEWRRAGIPLFFPGDSPSRIEEAWVPESANGVLKAGHHGSRGSSSMAFVQRVGPAVAVVMPGYSNWHGFPHPEAWERLVLASGMAQTVQEQGAVQVELEPNQAVRWRFWR